MTINISGAATQQFYKMLAEARTRVLTRNADQAEASAQHLRERVARFPEFAGEMEADARACDVYVAECRAAAADHTLPTPSGPHYPSKEANRG